MASRWTSQCSILVRQVWYPFTVPGKWGMEGLVEADKKPRIPVIGVYDIAGTSYCASRSMNGSHYTTCTSLPWWSLPQKSNLFLSSAIIGPCLKKSMSYRWSWSSSIPKTILICRHFSPRGSAVTKPAVGHTPDKGFWFESCSSKPRILSIALWGETVNSRFIWKPLNSDLSFGFFGLSAKSVGQLYSEIEGKG